MESLLTNPSNTHRAQQNSVLTDPSEVAALALMHKRERNDFNPLGLCQALFSFLTNSLLSGGLKRVSSGKTLPFSTENHPLLTLPSEPNVEELLSCPSTAQLQKRGPVLANPSPEMTLPKNHRKEGAKMVGEKSAAAKEGAEDEYVKVKTPPLMHSRRLFSVASIINEKSEDFIRTRKEAMRTEELLHAAVAADFLLCSSST